MKERYVHLTPRLQMALHLLSGNRVVADVGCDHGRLAAALLQSNACERVIATDISEPSLQKAKHLLTYIGLSDRVAFRLGDGLSVLQTGECNAIAILGMGGTLMAQLLDSVDVCICGASSIVVQPMRAQADIRAYLHRNCYRITEDRIIAEGRRLYQIIRAIPDTATQQTPNGWPKGYYDMGFVAWEQKDPLFTQLAMRELNQHKSRLLTAHGTDGEAKLMTKIRAIETILNLPT